MPRARLVTPSLVGAVVVRPHLWFTAVRQLSRLARRGWWHRPPFLPLPPADYLEFRLVTQYGSAHLASGGDIRARDVLDYLAWCRAWDKRQ